MKKGYIIGIIIIVIIFGVGTYAVAKNASSKSHLTTTTNEVATKATKATNSNSTNEVATKATFSSQEQENYYKLSQNVGDIGVPSPAMTTNLSQPKTINGVEYYKTYSYDTRAAYGDDTASSNDGNYAHLVSSKVMSLNGQSLQASQFGEVNTSNLSKAELENQIYKIAALYVEGYTANNPNLELNSNDDYQGNLNEAPSITVNLDNTKTVNNETLYNVNANVNNYNIPIYVGLDGYIYISSENYYNELFFPNEVN